MTITITINTGNAAFENKDAELARIVGKVADMLSHGNIASGVREAKPLRDSNGNTVGSVRVAGK